MIGMNALRNSFRNIDAEILMKVYEDDLEIKIKWLNKYDVRFKMCWFDKGEGLIKITGKSNKEKYNQMINDDKYLDELCEVQV